VGSAWVANMAVSSANVPNVVSLDVGRSDVYIYIYQCTITKGITINRIKVIVVTVLRTATLLPKRVTLQSF